MLPLTIQKFISDYEKYLEDEKRSHTDSEKIHVDEIASKIAVFYEKVRNIIDYREEHLLRKRTIDRALRRRVLLKDFDKRFAEPLIKELIRSGHLPNDSVPEEKIGEIQKIIDNLIFLLENSKFKDKEEKENASSWLISVAVSAIEEKLAPPVKDRLLSEMMFDYIRNNIVSKKINTSDEERDPLLFVAVQRALFRPEGDQLQYRLLRFAGHSWLEGETENLKTIMEKLPALQTSSAKLLHNPLGNGLLKICNREKIIFQLIGDLVFDGNKLTENWETALKAAYKERYEKNQIKLRKLALLSIVSFFVSKMLVAIAVEIPIDMYILKTFSVGITILNIALPPILMFLITILIKMPPEKNLELIMNSVKEVLDTNSERKYYFSGPKNKGGFDKIAMNLAYFLTLLIVLYFLIKLLVILNFSVANIFIFLIFTSVVIATGMKINSRSKEMSFIKEKPSVRNFILDLVIVPFMAIGKWTLSGLAKFNVLVIALNFLLELPFQLFIEFLENFRNFILFLSK
jgi:hypothetical protein